MKKIHFISSLPRSGSTLLCNILAQNPKCYSSQTSGLLDVLFGIRNQWDQLIEHKAHPLPVAKKNVMKAIVQAYYEDIDREIIFDKSRGWLNHLEMIEEIVGKVKVLVCIRPIPDILASLEKLHRETSKVKQPPGESNNYFQFQSQEGRCDYWMQGDQVVGLAHKRIIDAIQRGFENRMYFIPYEKLTSNPSETMKGIYNFLELPYFEHDFENVEQVTQEDDTLHGYVDLHKIKSKVTYTKSDAAQILGPELMKKYSIN